VITEEMYCIECKKLIWGTAIAYEPCPCVEKNGGGYKGLRIDTTITTKDE